MSDSEVLVDSADGVMTITLNRPHARNAVNLALAQSVADAIRELEENDDLRVGIVTGAGGNFCAGMDLKAFVKGENPVIEGYGFAGICSYIPKKPLIAAVEGYALAGGFEIAISCDLIIASEASRFGIPEVKRGLTAAAGGLVRLPKQISPRIAMELALTGDFITAGRAYEIGLINQVVAEGGALEAARALAEKIAANGPLAVAASKYLVARAQDWSNDEMFDRQEAVVKPVIQSEDAIEGSIAFAEKRAPVWKGR